MCSNRPPDAEGCDFAAVGNSASEGVDDVPGAYAALEGKALDDPPEAWQPPSDLGPVQEERTDGHEVAERDPGETIAAFTKERDAVRERRGKTFDGPTLAECLNHLTAATNRAAMLRCEAVYIDAPVARALMRWLRAEVEEEEGKA